MFLLTSPEALPCVRFTAAKRFRGLFAVMSLLVAALGCLSVAEAANQKPIANAGSDQVVGLSTAVHLDGRQSVDRDGTIKKYRWRQTKGPLVKLAYGKTAEASFTSPPKLKKKAVSAQLVFKLTVVDDKKATASDSVSISIFPSPICAVTEILQEGVCITPLRVCKPPAVLQNGICIAPTPLCALPRVLQNGICITPPPVCVFPEVLENGICVKSSPDCELPNVLQQRVCVSPSITPKFNDTGVTRCSDTNFTGVDCPLSLFPGQDAESGRDVTHYNDGDGHAGFSFTKIDEFGAELAPAASAWSCVKDNVTGLMWEVKTDDGGLRDKDLVYTNFSGTYNPTGQFGSAGDASGLVHAVNAQKLCGAADWRLPTVRELQGIVDYGVGLPGPTIDPAFFANTTGSAFWSASSHARNVNHGWLVYFDDGRVFEDSRDLGFKVRLVRGGQ